MNSAIEKYDDRDYMEMIVWNNDKFTWEENAAKTFSNIKYNQKLVDRYSCTWQAACGVISDVTWFALPLSFRKKVWENQLKTWAREKFGDSIINWVKQAVKLFNIENPELPYTLEYYRIRGIKKISMLHILNGSSILTWYKGSLLRDAQDNWIIDNIDNPDGWGHSIRIVKGWIEGNDIKMKYCDNYEGVHKYNIIRVNEFNKNKDFFTGGYYIKKRMKRS